MQLLDGKKIASELLEKIKLKVAELKEKGVTPKLTVVLVGENPASLVYVKKKEQACEKCGIISEQIKLPKTVTTEEVIAQVKKLNEDHSVHGILVQLPLPEQVYEPEVIKAINFYKDVDGFHAYNLGKMMLGKKFGFWVTEKK